MRKALKLGKETVGNQECPWKRFRMAKGPGRRDHPGLHSNT